MTLDCNNTNLYCFTHTVLSTKITINSILTQRYTEHGKGRPDCGFAQHGSHL